MLSILPRDTGFQTLLDQSAGTLRRTVQAFNTLMKSLDDIAGPMEAIRTLEHEGDENLRQTLDKLDRTFLTPFDREDIYRLARRIDDVVDAVDACTKRLYFYSMKQPTPALEKMANVLLRAGEAAARAIPRLRDLKHTRELREDLNEIQLAEREADALHHAALAELYDNETSVGKLMKWKEVYDITEKATDRCEDIADVIRGILVKGT